MATSIHADTSWQLPPTAQSGPRHSMSGSRRRALSIRRDQQGNRPPGPTSPLEVNVTMPFPGRCRVEGGCKARRKPRESDKCDGISMHSLIMAAARGTGRPVQFALVRRPTFKIDCLCCVRLAKRPLPRPLRPALRARPAKMQPVRTTGESQDSPAPEAACVPRTGPVLRLRGRRS
jgi:hypothetical protein